MLNQHEAEYLKIEEFIDEIKQRIESKDFSEPIHKKLIMLEKAIARINPFNNIIVDIHAESRHLDEKRSDLLDPMKKGMILLKLDFWKEKLRKSMDLIEL